MKKKILEPATSFEHDNEEILFSSETINKIQDAVAESAGQADPFFFFFLSLALLDLKLPGILLMVLRRLEFISSRESQVVGKGEISSVFLSQSCSLSLSLSVSFSPSLSLPSPCSRQVNLLYSPPPSALTWLSAQIVAATPPALIGSRTLHCFARREMTNLFSSSSFSSSTPSLCYCPASTSLLLSLSSLLSPLNSFVMAGFRSAASKLLASDQIH